MDQNQSAKKQNGRIVLKAVLLLLILASVAGAIVYLTRYAPGFHRDAGGTYYVSGKTRKREAGLFSVGQELYLLGSGGYVGTGWKEYDGKTFYLDGQGRAVRGICVIDGERYCFDPDQGVMLRGTFYTLPHSSPKEIYYFDKDGRSVTGLTQIGEDTYLFSENGTLVRGKAMVEGRLLCFGDDGRMQFGFVTLNEGTYYFGDFIGKEGTAARGFRNIGSDLYYFDPETHLMFTGFYESDDPEEAPMLFGDDGARGSGLTVYGGKTYYTDPFGTVVKGWIEEDGKKRLFGEDGVMTVGFYENEDGETLWFDENGVLASGWKSVEGEMYYFDENGVMAKDVCMIYGSLYRFEPDGRFYDGFRTVGENRYYYDEYGFPMSGIRTINGYLYCLGQDGKLTTDEWIEAPGGWMYFRGDGTAVRGDKTVGEAHCFFGEDGIAQTGFREIDGFTYYFDGKNGALTGTHVIDGVEYTFAQNGILASEIEEGRT